MKKTKALYPGSFDPLTYGHIDLVHRALELFNEVHVAIGINAEKIPLFSLEERLHFLRQAFGKRKGIIITAFRGLMVNYAKANHIGIIIRGLRATSDFDYEFQMAITNRMLGKNEIDTMFLMPSEKHFYLSSRLIKDIARLGGNVESFVPPDVGKALAKKFHTIERQM